MKTEHTASNEILTVERLAEMLGVSRARIYNLNSQHKIPCVKLGRRVYFFRQDIINLLNSNRKKSNDEIDAKTEAYLSRNKTGR